MKKSEFHRISVKGKVIIKNLNYGLMTLKELSFSDNDKLLAQEELLKSLLLISIEVAILCCGSDKWHDIHQYLSDIGVEIPEELHRDMAYLDKISEIDMSDLRHN